VHLFGTVSVVVNLIEIELQAKKRTSKDVLEKTNYK